MGGRRIFESLQYELDEFNIRVKIIEPGPIKTDFYDRSQVIAKKEGLTAYDHFVEKCCRICKRREPRHRTELLSQKPFTRP